MSFHSPPTSLSLNLISERVARRTTCIRGTAAGTSPVPIVLWLVPHPPWGPVLEFHPPGSRFVMEARIPSMSPACTTTDPLTERFSGPIALTPPLAKADKQCHRDDGEDEEDETDGQADLFAKLFAGRRGRRGRSVRGVGTRGGEQDEGGAFEDFGIIAPLVDDEGEGEVGGRLAFEPGGAHVEEDGTLEVGGVAGCEYVCCGWGVEASGVDVVQLYGVVCAVFKESGIPGHWEMLVASLKKGGTLSPGQR